MFVHRDSRETVLLPGLEGSSGSPPLLTCPASRPDARIWPGLPFAVLAGAKLTTQPSYRESSSRRRRCREAPGSKTRGRGREDREPVCRSGSRRLAARRPERGRHAGPDSQCLAPVALPAAVGGQRGARNQGEGARTRRRKSKEDVRTFQSGQTAPARGALAHGIPLVIAVQGEDKAEVAARLARTGVALRRAAGEPAGPDIRAAGGAVFGDPAWRTHARCLQTELWRHSSFDQITDAVAEVPRKRGPPLGPAKQLRLPRGDRRRRAAAPDESGGTCGPGKPEEPRWRSRSSLPFAIT